MSSLGGFTMRGSTAELRSGYHVVCRLTDWTLERGSLEGTPAEVNRFRLEHGGPFELRATVKDKVWSWRDVSVETSGARFVVRMAGTPAVRA